MKRYQCHTFAGTGASATPTPAGFLLLARKQALTRKIPASPSAFGLRSPSPPPRFHTDTSNPFRLGTPSIESKTHKHPDDADFVEDRRIKSSANKPLVRVSCEFQCVMTPPLIASGLLWTWYPRGKHSDRRFCL
uniref:Ig-like domain-containing protein n=1 Tax=Steinernema glaseri TaxID=37863 RepID=A0A1I7Y9L8_9BILA